MPKILTTSEATENGEVLWCVHFASSYFDTDPRAPGTVPVDARIFVLAKSRADAIKKAGPTIKKVARKCDRSGDSIEAGVVTLEDLVACRKSKDDGRLGWHSTSKLQEVSLTSTDSKRYGLGVALIPID